MSTRAVRKFTKTLSDAPPNREDAADVEEDEDDKTENEEPKNRFAMLEAVDQENEDIENNNADHGGQAGNAQKQRKKKQKKKGKNKAKPSDNDAVSPDDEIQRILDSLDEKEGNESKSKTKLQHGTSSTGDFRRSRTTESELFTIEYRHLNAENELKRIFGAATTKLFSSGLSAGERRAAGAGSKSRQQGAVSGGKIVVPRTTWPVFGKAGLSMKLVENRSGGINIFVFEHGPAYRQAQYEFWEAVEMMNPDAFMEILRNNPYHVDTLLQLSEVLRMQEDFQTSRDLVERAVYGCQAAFHPLFNVASAACRLEYRQRENRPFFLALFKHMQALCQRACVRTALEFCKLIFNLDADNDPLCMLLMIDYLALRSKQYDYLLDFYRIMEAKRNLSQLPNFCYSVALASFLKGTEDSAGNSSTADKDAMLAEADDLIRQAVFKFPTTLTALLEKCEVDADDMKRCGAFNSNEQAKDGIGMKQLSALYAARYFQLWKEPQTLQWLEENVRAVLSELDQAAASKPSEYAEQNSDGNYTALFTEFREYRRHRFQGTPRNILRHIVIADVKEAFVQLPLDIRDSAILSYDPLPPFDSVETYERPQRERRQGNDGFFGSFLRSLLPNYDPEAQPEEEAAGGAAAAEGGGVRVELQRSVHHLLEAMRDLLNNIQPTALPPDARADGPHADADAPDADADADWDTEQEDEQH